MHNNYVLFNTLNIIVLSHGFSNKLLYKMNNKRFISIYLCVIILCTIYNINIHMFLKIITLKRSIHFFSVK